MHKMLLVLSMVLLAGCVGVETLQKVSQGHTGCLKSDITIIDDSGSVSVLGDRTWIVECGEKRFACSAFSDGGDTLDNIACSEVQKPPAKKANN
jgi:hypothetical protein